MAVIGIDLGTTNSLAAVWRNGRSELIPNAAGGFLTPSAVSVDADGTILVGQAARERLISHPDRTAAGFKREMGSGTTLRLGERDFSPEELSSLVLRRLREDAEAYLGEPVTEAVVSVPAYFAEGQRAATKRAAALAGLRVERLVNEPSAAALASGADPEGAVCLVFDLGGGTLDVSLVEAFENVVSVTAVSGDNRLGGRDFDLAIARGFCQDCGLSFEGLPPRQREMILRQAEVCKMALTTQEPVMMVVDDGTFAASLSLSNEWLIRKCAALFQRMEAPLRKVFLDAGVSPGELDHLVMVGGSCHMPSVRRYVARLLRREPDPDTRPDTAVALGAGICAGMKARVPDLRDLILTDVCPFTLGVDVFNRANPMRMLMAPLIERNSVLPVSRTEQFTTVRDGQKLISFHIYQGEQRYCDENTLLGELSVQVPPAPRGTQSVQVRFTYDINGLLEAEAVNSAGQTSRLVLRNRDMDEGEAARRLREMEALKLHPREQEVNRALSARGERLYAVTVGELRRQVAEMLDWFQEELDSREPVRMARARRRAEYFFDQADAWLEGGADPEDWEGPEDWEAADGGAADEETWL